MKGCTMVDFNELKNKAEAFATEHASQIKQGIGKAGDLVGGKIGHEKVDPIENKLTGFLDGLGRKDEETPAADPTVVTPAPAPTPPPAATTVTPPTVTPPTVTPPTTTPPTVTPPTPPAV
jgi:hypothetical protein